MKKTSSIGWALALVSATYVPAALGVDAGGVVVHGAISLTGAGSDQYNYLGETRDSFDLNVKEVTVNGAYRFENGRRKSTRSISAVIAMSCSTSRTSTTP